MSNGEKQIGVKVDEQLWQQFRQDVSDRKGRVHGHLKTEVETALSEYIHASRGGDTHDRLRRLENDMDRVVTLLENLSTKKENSDVGSRVEGKLEDIIQTVEKEADGAPRVHDSVIEMAIETHAGYSDPTIRQYKELLNKRKVAFEDPRRENNYHYLDAPTYCSAVNQSLQDGEIKRETYVNLVENTYTRDWWGQQIQRFEDRANGSSDRTPGFQ